MHKIVYLHYNLDGNDEGRLWEWISLENKVEFVSFIPRRLRRDLI
jgi:hypothetical protein